MGGAQRMRRASGTAAFCASSKGENRTNLIFWGSAGPSGAGIGVFRTFLAAEKLRAHQGHHHWISQVPSCPQVKIFSLCSFGELGGIIRSLLCEKTLPFPPKTPDFSINPARTGAGKIRLDFVSP